MNPCRSLQVGLRLSWCCTGRHALISLASELTGTQLVQLVSEYLNASSETISCRLDSELILIVVRVAWIITFIIQWWKQLMLHRFLLENLYQFC